MALTSMPYTSEKVASISYSLLSQEIGWKNVSEMIYFVLGGT